MNMKILSLLVLILVAAGCSDSSNNSTSSGNGSSVTGDLLGSVILTDHRGRPMRDYSGVTVQVEGTSFSAVTDTAGNWVIHNLPSRTYAITFSKPDFYSYHDKSFSFLGGAPVRYITPRLQNPYVYLGGLPRFKVTLDAILMPEKTTTDSGNTFLFTNGTLYAHTSDDGPDSTNVGTYVIISRDPNLRIENPSSYFYLMSVNGYTYATRDTIVNLSTTVGYGWFAVWNVHPGDTIYFKAYPVLGNPMEYDVIKNTEVFIGYSSAASNVLSGVMK
jgi:hypothetical protein